MPQIVECPGCGRPLWIGDAGSGLTTVCSHCKTEVEAPGSKPSKPVEKKPRLFSPGAWAGLVGLLVVTGSGAWYFMIRPSVPLVAVDGRPPTSAPASVGVMSAAKDPWESSTRSQLLEWKKEGDRLAADGQLASARQQYRQMIERVGSRQLASADLRQALADASRAQQRIVDELLQSANATATVTAPSTVPTTSAALVLAAPPAVPVAPASASSGVTNMEVKRPASAPVATAEIAKVPRPVVTMARKAQPIVSTEISDDEVGAAIQKGVDYILGRLDGNHLRDIHYDTTINIGVNSLAIYSLLQASLAIKDERLNIKGPLMKGLLDTLRKAKIEGDHEVYARALRAITLAVFNRTEDARVLKADVAWLIAANKKGGYGYMASLESTDNSNAQYGLLGVWAGAEAGFEVSHSYWQAVEKYWTKAQRPDGQWGYYDTASERVGFAMDCAGIASLFICHDYIEAPTAGRQLGRPPFSKELERAMNFMEQGNHAVTLNLGSDSSPVWFVGYNLYGLERIGLASGMKHMGAHDWYRELAKTVVAAQKPDGSWEGLGEAMQVGISRPDFALLDQFYTVLFLSRGRHPVMFNKLRYDGFWSNRPRDVANLARYASRELEHPLNWQIVGGQKGWQDWMDCPILYLAGHEPPKLTDADYDNLRAFALAGGTIYCNSDGSSEPFSSFVNQLAKKLFPIYEMATLPLDHPIYTMVFPMKVRPVIRGVSNGARLLLVHTPGDPAFAWQQRADKSQANAFELGTNIFVYAAGKTDFRNRLTSPVIPAPSAAPSYTVPMALLKYPSNWNPEPEAMGRFSNYLWQQTGWALDLKPTDMAALTPATAPIAHLTGTATYTPNPQEVVALKNYVEAGGVLVIDSCGGGAAFARSAETSLLPRAFPKEFGAVVDPNHPLLNGKSDCATELAHTRIRIGPTPPPSPAGVRMLTAGKGHVIYTPMDITSGLLGTSTAGITGFRYEYAQPLMKNIVLWTMDGQRDN